jgi:hypothetical protein
MSYEPTPSGPNPEDLPRYVAQELSRVGSAIGRIRDALSFLQEYVRVQGLTVEWAWDDSTTMANPGLGNMRGDDNAFPGITQFAVSLTDFFGETFRGGLLPSILPVRITVRNGRTGNYGIWTLTDVEYFEGPPTWALWSVTWVDGDNDNPQLGDLMEVRLQPQRIPGEFRG